jgi:hypothetical protein
MKIADLGRKSFTFSRGSGSFHSSAFTGTLPGFADSPTRFVFFVPLSPNYRMRTLAKITFNSSRFTRPA